MALDDIKRRFVDEIKLRAYEDKYIDKNEEREILQLAIQQGISLDKARGALAQVCEQQGYVLESTVVAKIKHDVDAAMGNDGKLDESEFSLIVASAKRAFLNKKNDLQVKRVVIELMEENGMNQVKTGWFSNWYARVKQEVGLG
jgi:hypothetical protein